MDVSHAECTPATADLDHSSSEGAPADDPLIAIPSAALAPPIYDESDPTLTATPHEANSEGSFMDLLESEDSWFVG